VGEPFERRRLRVYVAGPISSNVFEGVQRGVAAGRQMFLDGLAPFVPHFDAFWWLPDGNWRAYLEYDLEYVSICDAVYRLEGESKGADLECRIAEEHGIPVFYESDSLGYLALLQYAEDQGLSGIRQAADGPVEVAK
jgi:hypothetical protein